MSSTPIWQWAAHELHQAYRTGRITPIDALESSLSQFNFWESSLNAMTQVLVHSAREQAIAATQRYAKGQPLSVLDGVPFTVKDSVFVKGTLSTWGTVALGDHEAQQTELGVKRLLAAGAVLLGKTNLCEFTLEGYTNNPLFGVTANPWDLALTPGGSSGGAAASVAAGYTPFAIGTDVGGSTRRPASHCGLLGLKLGLDTVYRDHMFPAYMYDFDVLGILARDPQDVQAVFGVMAGGHPTQVSLQGEKILYVPAIGSFPVDKEILAACEQQVEGLRQLGYTVETATLPFDLRFTTDQWVLMAERVLSELFDHHPEWEATASQNFVELAQRGRQHPAALRSQLIQDIRSLRVDTDKMFTEYACVATPATAALPWPKSEKFPPLIAEQPVGPRGHAIFASWVNAAGLPSIAIPAPVKSGALPRGIQCVGPMYSEQAITELAQKLMKKTHCVMAFP